MSAPTTILAPLIATLEPNALPGPPPEEGLGLILVCCVQTAPLRVKM
jgi:hypothetical protein